MKVRKRMKELPEWETFLRRAFPGSRYSDPELPEQLYREDFVDGRRGTNEQQLVEVLWYSRQSPAQGWLISMYVCAGPGADDDEIRRCQKVQSGWLEDSRYPII